MQLELTGLMGGLYRACEWIMRFFVTNVLWLLFNLPIVFFVLNLLLAETINAVAVSMLPIAILVPFVFFPATTAMFAVVRKWIMKQPDIPIVRSFLKYG
jgi:uncharacterized membrane protein YesL